MQLEPQTIKSMKQITTDIGNYVKGRLKRSVKMQHLKYYTSLPFKMLSKKPHLLTNIILVVNILAIRMCSCER